MPWRSRCSLTMQTRDRKVLLNDLPFGTLWITNVFEFGNIVTDRPVNYIILKLYNSEYTGDSNPRHST